MDKVLIVVIALIVIAAIGLPLLAQLVKDEDEVEVAAAPPPPPLPELKPRASLSPSTSAAPPLPFSMSGSGQSSGGIDLPPGVERAKPGEPQRVAPERKNAEKPKLNAKNLVGTKWAFQGGSLQLLQGGQARLRHPDMAQLGLPPEMVRQGVPGAWSVRGKWIRLSAMGYTIEAQIVGEEIIGPNGPIRRAR